MNYLLFFILYALGLLLVFSISFGWVPRRFRYPFFGLLIVGVTVSALAYRLDYRDLGLQLPTKTSVFAYLAVTLVLVLGYLVTAKYVLRLKPGKILHLGLSYKSIGYLLLSVPIQELVFRGYLYAVFQHFHWNSMWLYVLTSGATFLFVHIYYKNKYIYVATFLVGVIYGLLFYQYQDLFSISVSHAILGLVVTLI